MQNEFYIAVVDDKNGACSIHEIVNEKQAVQAIEDKKLRYKHLSALTRKDAEREAEELFPNFHHIESGLCHESSNGASDRRLARAPKSSIPCPM
jgi:hypothetical protein